MPSLQVRSKSVPNPFQVRSGTIGSAKVERRIIGVTSDFLQTHLFRFSNRFFQKSERIWMKIQNTELFTRFTKLKQVLHKARQAKASHRINGIFRSFRVQKKLLILFREFVFPVGVGVGEKMGVVEMAVACYFWSEE